MFNKHAYNADAAHNEPTNPDMVLAAIDANQGISCYELYTQLDVGDINLYLALHQLIERGDIMGPDPYDTDTPSSMSAWKYSSVIRVEFQILVIREDRSLSKDFAFNRESLAGHIQQHKADGVTGMYVIKTETGECKYASKMSNWKWSEVTTADAVKAYFA